MIATVLWEVVTDLIPFSAGAFEAWTVFINSHQDIAKNYLRKVPLDWLILQALESPMRELSPLKRKFPEGLTHAASLGGAGEPGTRGSTAFTTLGLFRRGPLSSWPGRPTIWPDRGEWGAGTLFL